MERTDHGDESAAQDPFSAYAGAHAVAAPSAKKQLCSMCMGAFAEGQLESVDGRSLCPSCRSRQAPAAPAYGASGGTPGTVAVRSYSAPATRSRAVTPHRRKHLGVAGLCTAAAIGAAFFFDLPSLFAHDRIDDLLAGVDSGRGDALELVQSYTAGETLGYAVSMNIAMEGEMDLPGGAMPGPMGGQDGDFSVDMKLTGAVSIDVLSVDKQGNAQLRASLNGFAGEGGVKVGGRRVKAPNSLAGALSGVTFELEVDPYGGIISDPVTENGEMKIGQLKDFVTGKLQQVPHRALKVGDTWTVVEDMPSTGGPGLPGMSPSVAVTYTVEGFKTVQGRECLVISLVGTAAGLDGASAMGGKGFDMDIDVDLKGAIFYDPAAKRMVKSAIDVDMDMSMDAGEMSTSFNGTIAFDVDLL